MTEITIGGREFKIEFNAYAAMAFEELSGHNAFDLEYVQKNQFKYSMQALYAMLIANNDTTAVPEFDQIAREFKDVESLNTVMSASAKEIEAWYKPMMRDIKAKRPKKGKGDDEKNA